MERLSGLDASFLYLESRSQLMHISGVLTLDTSTIPGGYDFGRFRAELGRRVAVIPSFRRRLHDSLLNLDHPVWVEDRNFDIERHVHRVALPSPGGKAELFDLISHIAGQPLDRSKPLWELWVIEGVKLGKSKKSSGEIAVMIRMHHASTDGVTGAGLLTQLCSLTPENPVLDETRLADNAGDAHRLELALEGIKNVAARPLNFAKLLPGTAKIPVSWMRRAQTGSAMPTPFSAPRTLFNATITGHRSVALTQVPLADLKAIRTHFDVKLNDVVLALCGGALREYLLKYDVLPDDSLIAMVPVSVVDSADNSMRTGPRGTNQVSGMFVRLATQHADPVARLAAIADECAVAKEHHASLDPHLLRSWAQFIPAGVLSKAMDVYGKRQLAERHNVIHNLVISNVAGPDIPLYFLGAEIKTMCPLGPIFHGSGINITVLSGNGMLNFGVIACKELVPDPEKITDEIQLQLHQLLAAI